MLRRAAKSVLRRARRLPAAQAGLTAVEYAVLLGLIIAAVTFGLRTLGVRMNASIGTVNAAMGDGAFAARGRGHAGDGAAAKSKGRKGGGSAAASAGGRGTHGKGKGKGKRGKGKPDKGKRDKGKRGKDKGGRKD